MIHSLKPLFKQIYVSLSTSDTSNITHVVTFFHWSDYLPVSNPNPSKIAWYYGEHYLNSFTKKVSWIPGRNAISLIYGWKY